MELLTYLLFALALNLDSFGAGMAYGTRQIRVPVISLIIISLISVAAICISMLGGRCLLSFIPASLAHRLGGMLLLLVGLWVLLQTRNEGEHAKKPPAHQTSGGKVFEIHIRPLGLVVRVLKEPALADLDQSGVISPAEALVLGTALAMDAFGAGFAVSMLGFSLFTTALVVGTGHFFLTYLGLLAGRTINASNIGRRLTFLPGCILILLGLFKIC
ncbi:MAG: putative membrane protein [Pelotomaculum thermopropionicum]|uniref:Putative membrane protein n=1 Tax=Pelotomaculum thermopropionicum TaxID=110500 RepID=A0A101HSB3_9FIRM|nr:MAG: putative membrane protein [Pelotomaculum thermopropionicum]